MLSAFTAAKIAVAISGRMHGIGNSILRLLSYPFLGIGMLIASATLHGWPLGILGTVICLVAFALAHGNFYEMQGVDKDNDNPEWIERQGARWIWQSIFGDDAIYTPGYSIWCMSLKWALVGVCAVPYGLLLAIVSPMFYAISFTATKSSALAEWFTTIYAAILISWVLVAHPQLLAERLGEAERFVSRFSHGIIISDRVKFRYEDGGLHAA